MIQRKQSLLLLGAALISLLLLYLPVYERLPAIADIKILSERIDISKSAILLILNGAIGVLTLLAIFMFKTRNLQIRICNLSILLTCIFIGLLFFMADTMSSDKLRIHYLYGSYLPLIQLILIYLAMRFIKKDEDLVRSADRLR